MRIMGNKTISQSYIINQTNSSFCTDNNGNWYGFKDLKLRTSRECFWFSPLATWWLWPLSAPTPSCELPTSLPSASASESRPPSVSASPPPSASASPLLAKIVPQNWPVVHYHKNRHQSLLVSWTHHLLLDCDLACNGFFIINGKEIIGDVFSMKASFRESKSNEDTSTI